jgi:hypothetical protein
LGGEVRNPVLPSGKVLGGVSGYAYLFEWNEFYAPRLLIELQKAGVQAKVSQRPFTMNIGGQQKNFDYGTIMIPVAAQSLPSDQLFALITAASEKNGIDVYPVTTGMTDGINLGSSNFKRVETPQIAMITGQGVNNNDAGEAWHLLDQRFGIPPTLIEQNTVNRISLDRYNVMVMADGIYAGINENGKEEIKRWIRNGGVLIASGEANRWAGNAGITTVKYKEIKNTDPVRFRNYDTQAEVRGSQYIPGAIFNTRVDKTHPIAYGIKDQAVPVFREGTNIFELPPNPFATPVSYTSKPLIAGYISGENEKLLSGSAAVICNDFGRGQVISFADNPNFRAFWFGTSKLFMNAVFFGQTIGR